jgi:hypothetical protein
MARDVTIGKDCTLDELKSLCWLGVSVSVKLASGIARPRVWNSG